MDNEILEEQRRAREEFLQLKKMQNCEIKPEPKPSEMEIKPKTFKEKLQNYWFHYKWHTIATVFSVIILAVLVSQCANREKYDYTVVLFSYKSCLDAQTERIEEYLENYSTDLDGDGKVNVSVINCSFNNDGNLQYKNTMLTKVQTQIVGNKEAVMFMVDKDAYDYMQTIADGGIFGDEPFVLGEDFYNKTETEGLGKLPEGLMLALRRVNGTMLENEERTKAVYNECKNVIEKIKAN